MPLLLLLSALLTALTGVVAGVRPAEVHVARQAQLAEASHNAAPVMQNLRGHRHLLGAFGNIQGFASRTIDGRMLAVAPRLYLDRPRA